MNNDWLKNEQAVDHVKRLLRNSGAPLEVRTAKICQQFITEQSSQYGKALFSSERVIYYQDVQEFKLREIDRVVDIEARISIGGVDFVNLNLHIPIECKYRSLDAFAFPTEVNIFDVYQISNPVMAWTDVGSRLVRNFLDVRPELFADEPISLITFLEYDYEKSKYKGVYKDDDHVYKAGTAIYDYIKSKIPPVPLHVEDDVLAQLGILNPAEIVTFHPKSVYWSWHVNADTIMPPTPLEPYIQYNQRQPDNVNHWHTIDVYFPIMCINSQLYATNISEEGDIQEIQQRPFFLTSVTVPSWPDATPHYLAGVGKESLLAITNPDHLKEVLDGLMEWYFSLIAFLQNAGEDFVRLPLETAIFAQMLNRSENDVEGHKYLWPGIL